MSTHFIFDINRKSLKVLKYSLKYGIILKQLIGYTFEVSKIFRRCKPPSYYEGVKNMKISNIKKYIRRHNYDTEI